MVINGVRFRHGTVEWEDAFGHACAALPSFDAMREGKEYVGTKIYSVGFVAKIGNYIIIITKINEIDGTYDYTLVPFTHSTITYTRRNKKCQS